MYAQVQRMSYSGALGDDSGERLSFVAYSEACSAHHNIILTASRLSIQLLKG